MVSYYEYASKLKYPLYLIVKGENESENEGDPESSGNNEDREVYF